MAVRDRRDAGTTTASIRWESGVLSLLDQTRLPGDRQWLRCERPEEVAVAIRRLAVRGAPAIGLAAAFGLALVAGEPRRGETALRDRVRATVELLAATRPTAGELRSTLEEGDAEVVRALPHGEEAARAALVEFAKRVCDRQCRATRALAEHGAQLLSRGQRVLTHCNTGAIATGTRDGTALGIIQAAHRTAPLDMVWVGETRPLLQGARLTAWELGQAGVRYQIVVDASAGALMARGLVDAVVVGADRIAANGDVANKVGTYTLAALAERHDLPFIVAAPRSTFDRGLQTGEDIPIERRSADEVTSIAGVHVAPPGAEALNLAFDVTPAELISAIVTDVGVLLPPYDESISSALQDGRSPALASGVPAWT